MQTFDLDVSAITDFGKALARAPIKLSRAMGMAFRRIGKSDIDKLKREQLSGGGGHLKIKRQGLRNAFKSWASTGDSLNQLSLSEYTGWKAFRIFETGGTIVPRNKRSLMVLTDSARTAGGKRKWTQKQMQAMIKSGELKVIRTPKITMIVRNVGGLNKAGGYKKNSRADIVAYLVPSVRLRKMLDFYGNFRNNSAEHDKLLGEAVQSVLADLAKGKGE